MNRWICLLFLTTSPELFAQPAVVPEIPDPLKEPQSPPKPIPTGMKFIDQGTRNPKLKGYISPEGFKVEIFDEAPSIINPVGFTFGPDGSMFVLEWRPDDNVLPETPEKFTYKDGTTRTIATMKKKVKDVVKVLPYRQGTYGEARVILHDELPSSILVHDGMLYTASRGTVRRWKLADIIKGDNLDAKPEVIAQGFCGFHHHQVSGLTIGNDGLLYITSGDDDNYVEGSDGSRATVLRTGAVFRCRPDGSKMEVFSIGYRNPYRNLVQDDRGNWFHIDNDNEDGSKFTGCRLMHVAEGSDFGWRLLQGARCCKPDPVRGAAFGELPGKMPPMLKTGRGAPAGLMIYGGRAFPEFYRGWLFYPDVFRKLIRAYKVAPSGSTFEVTHEFEFLKSDDPLFRPCQMLTGPDGAIYICDWRTDSGGAGRLFGDGKNGRIYRVTFQPVRDPKNPLKPEREEKLHSWRDVGPDSSLETLSQAIFSEDADVIRLAQWEFVRRAKSATEEVRPVLLSIVQSKQAVSARVACLGALNSVWDESIHPILLKLLNDPSPDIRRLAAESLALNCKPGDREAHSALLKALSDTNLAVRRAVVLAMGKLNAENAAEVLVTTYQFDKGECVYLTDGILRAIERTGKPGVHKLLELACSGKDEDREKVVTAFLAMRTKPAAEAIPDLLVDPHLTADQRVALIKSYTNYLFDPPLAMDGLLDFLVSRPKEPMAVQLAAIEVLSLTGNMKGAKVSNLLTNLLDAKDSSARLIAIRAIEQGKVDPAAPRLVQVLGDAKRSPEERVAIIRALRVLSDKGISEVLKEILLAETPAFLRTEALHSLATIDPKAANGIAEKFLEQADPGLLRESLQVLGTRPEGAKLVGQRYLDKKLSRDFLPQVSESLRKHADQSPELKQMLTEVMKGGLLISNSPMEMEKVRQLVLTKGNAQRGKAIYLNSKQLACVTCHKLEGAGGQIGPDLTKLWESASIDQLLESIIDPNKEIKEGFQSFKATTKSGQTFVGLKVIDKPTEITIRDSTGKDTTIPRTELQTLTALKQSLMPDNVVSQLSFEQFLDLIAFLKHREAQESLRGMVTEYLVVGPFASDLQTDDGPESNPDKFTWQTHHAEPNGYMNLRTVFGKERISAYAQTHVHSPKAQQATLFVGADDTLRIWVNGKQIHEHTTPRPAIPDNDRVVIDLKEGGNTIVIKVVNRLGDHGLYLRVQGEGVRAAIRK